MNIQSRIKRWHTRHSQTVRCVCPSNNRQSGEALAHAAIDKHHSTSNNRQSTIGEIATLRGLASEFAWHSRWWSILSVAAQRALVLSLIEVDSDAIKPLADFEPRVGDILADVRYELGAVESRLPLRG